MNRIFIAIGIAFLLCANVGAQTLNGGNGAFNSQVLFDNFQRPNGLIGSPPWRSSQWSQIAPGVQIVRAAISSNTLAASDSGFATTAAYTGWDFGAPITQMWASISFGSGTANNGSVDLISNQNGVSSVVNITDKSIHIVFTDTKIDVAVFLAQVYTVIQTINYSSVAAHDGTQYPIGWILSGSDLTLYPATGPPQTVTDARFSTYGGRYGTYEIFWTGSGAARPVMSSIGGRTQ